MPRTSRKISYTKLYHIILRGIDRLDIFIDKNDYRKFLDILKETMNKYQYEIYVYCLMTNHVHLIIYDKEEKISKIMQSVEVRYSSYFNKKYDRTGHLFQNRFISKSIENFRYLITACRYIHQNPEKAKMKKTEEYEWSSYREYLEKPILISKNIPNLLFGVNEKEGKRQFVEFHKINENSIFDLIEYEMQSRLTDSQLIQYICELLEINNVHEILELSKDIRNKKIEIIKENLKVTSSQISRVLGISRKIIEKIK